MKKMPDIAESIPPWQRPIPLWFCLDCDTQKALQKYQRRKYHTELNPPSSPADIIDFDPAKEMIKPPGEGEQHMRS